MRLPSILPREVRFFEMFVQQAETIHEGAQMLLEMMEKCDNLPARGDHIKAVEHRGDTIAHDIITRLNQTFITPLDREDIHELASRLDDVLDFIESASNRMMLYKMAAPPADAVEMAQIILRCTEQVVAAVNTLEKTDSILGHCIEINRLENEGDRISRSAIAQLFEHERDPIVIIKWKEIYEALEGAIDRCEDVANVLESVVLKSA